jgi:hypothetical protein
MKETGSITVTNVVDHEDDGCTMSFDMDDETAKTMSSYGIKFVLFCAVYDVTIDQAFDRIAGRGVL